MKTIGLMLSLLVLSSAAEAAGVPLYITYQGTLKQSGVPATGPHNMSFKLTDSQGSAQYGSVVNLSNVTINQGLFAVQLDFTSNGTTPVDWQNVAPYIQVSIDGQSLSPVEPLESTVYSLMSVSVIDGAITTPKIAAGAVTTAQLANASVTTPIVADGSITTSKLDPGVSSYLVPSGAIMMFATSCPAGWARFSALDNVFPLGSSTYGTTGGSATHNHGGATGGPSDTQNGYVFGNSQGSGSFQAFWGTGLSPQSPGHSHTISTASNIPPYMTVVYCQKQ